MLRAMAEGSLPIVHEVKAACRAAIETKREGL
jgi:hypothetical protein